MRGFILALGLLAAPVSAQEMVFDPGVVEACFASTAIGDRAPHCLGAASGQCQELSNGGGSTLGIVACIDAETQAWDGLLNAEYAATRDHLRAVRAELADHLLVAQRAWIAFRDADCELAYQRWAEGTLRGVVFANCMMVMTAQRTLELRDMRDGGS